VGLEPALPVTVSVSVPVTVSLSLSPSWARMKSLLPCPLRPAELCEAGPACSSKGGNERQFFVAGLEQHASYATRSHVGAHHWADLGGEELLDLERLLQ